MEERSRAHEIATGLEGDTTRRLGVLQLLIGGEVPIQQDRICEPPQMLCRLEFRRIRRQEEQMHMVRHMQALRAMPARAIQHQYDLPGWTCTHCDGEGREFRFKERHADRGRQVKDGATGGRMDEAHEVSPLIPMLDRGKRTLVVQTPHLVQDGLQPNAVFVDRPELDDAAWKGRDDLA